MKSPYEEDLRIAMMDFPDELLRKGRGPTEEGCYDLEDYKQDIRRMLAGEGMEEQRLEAHESGKVPAMAQQVMLDLDLVGIKKYAAQDRIKELEKQRLKREEEERKTIGWKLWHAIETTMMAQ